MNFSLYIAKRYAASFSKSNAINIITTIASVGVVISAMSLFVVLSVFSGLKEFSLSYSKVTDPDLKIEAKKGKSFFITKEEEQKLTQSPFLQAYSKVLEERVYFTFEEKEVVAHIKGVNRNFTMINNFAEKLYAGNWLEPESNEVVVGAGISNKLSMGLFDYNNALTVLAPKPGKGAIENVDQAFSKAFLYPTGIFSVDEELDNKYVFADLELVQQLLGYKSNQISHIECKLKNNANEEEAVAELETIFKNKVRIKNRMQLNESLNKMLNTENIIVYLIFTLVIVITLFNLVGALIMMIIEKKSNLITLHNLGVEISNLKRIFLYQGTILTFFGGVLGVFLGIVVVFIQQHFPFIFITENFAYPVVFELKNLVIVLTTIFGFGYLASWMASRSIKKSFLEK